MGHYNDNGIAYNKYSTSDSVDLNKCDYVNFYDENGSKIKANLINGNVYTVAESYDKKNLSFTYYRVAKVSGSVSAVYTESGEIGLDGNRYKLDKNLIKYSNLPAANTNCDLYLDNYGYVVAITEKRNADDYKLAYVMDFACENQVFGNADFMFKLLVEDGKITQTKTAEKFILDGVTRTVDGIVKNSATLVPGSTINGKFDFSGQIIRFKADAEGTIKEIDTILVSDKEKESEGYNLTKYPDNVYEDILPGVSKNRKQLRIVNQGGTVYRLDSNILYKPDNTSVMFNVPMTDSEGYLMHENAWSNKEGTYLINQEYIYGENGEKIKADDSMYQVGHKTLTNVYSYVMDVYDTDKDSPYAECLVHHYPVANRNRNVQMITGFSEGMDKEGDVKNIITLRQSGADVDYYVGNNGLLNDLKEGDVVIADYDSNTKILYNITKVYDRETNTIIPNPYSNTTGYENWAGGGYISSYIHFLEFGQMTKGKVLKKTGTVLYINWNNDGVYDEIAETKSAPITVYEEGIYSKLDGFRSGTIADIDDYESVGENCSEILCAQEFGKILDIYVFK